jgi:predicted HicB family RNase H-like nuclease
VQATWPDTPVVKEKGIEPRRQFSAEFSLRIPTELQGRLAIAAQPEGKSIDSLAQEASRDPYTHRHVPA